MDDNNVKINVLNSAKHNENNNKNKLKPLKLNANVRIKYHG